MHVTAIINGHVIDPANSIFSIRNVFIRNGRISEISERSPDEGGEVFDAAGLFVSPGFIDLHTHLREPGFEYKEDIASGAAAAAAGGFTTIFCMANTCPVNDNPETFRYIRRKSAEAGIVTIHPVGAITEGLNGKRLADLEALKNAGAIAISDDGRTISDGGLMKRAMEEAARLGLLVISHAEPEEAMIARDVMLAEETGARLHIAHVSTAAGAELIRRAKGRGIRVTAEATPHHLLLTEDDAALLGANAKMNPPLRTEADRRALVTAASDGTIDAIATDHAPHAPHEKADPKTAASGVIGMETALPVCHGLVEEGMITLEALVKLFTVGPACVAGLNSGCLSTGAPANITVFDVRDAYTIDPSLFKSKSRNTPFAGRRVRGRVLHVLAGGNVVKTP